MPNSAHAARWTPQTGGRLFGKTVMHSFQCSHTQNLCWPCRWFQWEGLAVDPAEWASSHSCLPSCLASQAPPLSWACPRPPLRQVQLLPSCQFCKLSDHSFVCIHNQESPLLSGHGGKKPVAETGCASVCKVSLILSELQMQNTFA